MCRKLCHLIWGIWWFHRSKDFEAIWPRLSCQYSENTLMDLPSSVGLKKKSKLNSHYQLITNFVQKVCTVHTRALAFAQKKRGFLYKKYGSTYSWSLMKGLHLQSLRSGCQYLILGFSFKLTFISFSPFSLLCTSW